VRSFVPRTSPVWNRERGGSGSWSSDGEERRVLPSFRHSRSGPARPRVFVGRLRCSGLVACLLPAGRPEGAWTRKRGAGVGFRHGLLGVPNSSKTTGIFLIPVVVTTAPREG
jgi:hypothetical protein